LGLFDEALVRNQDDELNLRLLRAGGKIWQDRTIVSWYSPRPTLSGLFGQYWQYGFWKVAVIRKHRIPASWRHMVPVSFIMVCMLLTAAIALTAFAGALPIATAAAALLVPLLAAYGAAAVAASLTTARRTEWAALLYLPVVFATYHFSYGLGFLAGIFFFASRSARSLRGDSAFSRITRSRWPSGRL
jgi:hypothetical protein